MIGLHKPIPKMIYFLILSSGFAASFWEVIWQSKSSLALGLSAWGTALTLAIMMGGMSLGSFLMGRALNKMSTVEPLHYYGILEIIIGICGGLLNAAFIQLANIDTSAYQWMPHSISFIYLLGMIMIVGLPSLCMGATMPLFGLLSVQLEISITKLYSLNIFGSAGSLLIVAFILIPQLGIRHSTWTIATINIVIGITALLLRGKKVSLPTPSLTNQNRAPLQADFYIA